MRVLGEGRIVCTDVSALWALVLAKPRALGKEAHGSGKRCYFFHRYLKYGL